MPAVVAMLRYQPIGWKRIAALRWRLIPDATNTEAVLLTGVVAVNIGTVVVQSADPCAVRIELCPTPPVAAVANGAVCTICTIAEAVTARESGEAAAIGGTSVGGIPASDGLHFTSCQIRE